MPKPQDDVEELHSDGAESNEVEVNRDLFKDIKFYLHESIKKRFSRNNLTRDIERYGGIVHHTYYGCDTVLVDVLFAKKEILQSKFNDQNDAELRKVYVEYASFVQHCIRHNLFVHRIPGPTGMGGTVGAGRVRFTERDDECLCYYLARKIPDKAAGGRLGLNVYKMLVEMSKEATKVGDSHEWTARHSAESWKERYKKKAIEFDERIEEIVKLEGRSRKLLWHQDRRAGHKVLRGKHKIEPEDETSEDETSEDETSEGEYEEEPQQPSRKRRRSDYSSSPINRRRVVQHPSNEKGKGRAVEEGDEEELNESDPFEGLFSMNELNEYEPGPSRSQHPLEATSVAVDDLTHRTQPNTASFFTQETIVASAPSGRSVQLKEASHLPDEAAASSSHVRPSLQETRGETKTSTSGLEPFQVIDLTSPSLSTRHKSPVIQHSPTRTLVNPPQTQAAQPSTYKRPLKAARRPRAMIEAAAADAPYKNTRSRSQSVEPLTSNPPVREGGTKGKQKAIPELSTVDEVWDDRQGSENMEVAIKSVPPTVGETLANEVEVEKMLIEDEDEDESEEESEDEDKDEDEDEELDDANQVRGVSLDTDDAQTEQNLRTTQPPPRQVIPSIQRRPFEILKEFQAHSAIFTDRSSVPLTGRSHFHFSNKPTVPVRNTQENMFNFPSSSLGRNIAYKVTEPPRTPRRWSRKNSTSSTELFPVFGTRASAVKKMQQQREKLSSYSPPNGTRAAQFARSRN